MSSRSKICVFTLNCWGIPVISRDREHRIKAIADVLCSGRYDLICLQEIWDTEDYFYLKKKVYEVLPYSHYFYSGVLGSGLCVFSKFPFEDVFFHQWSLNGYVHKIQHGDWFGGKGIGLCTMKINNIAVNLYTAHLHAEYNRVNDEYLSHRVLQAFDTAQFVRLTSRNSDVVILGGDLNTEPSDLAYQILCSEAELEDAFFLSGEVVENGSGTNESIRNSYANKENVKANPKGKRIDYVLLKTAPSVQVEKVEYMFPLPPRIPNRSFSYSDHEAVAATIVLDRNMQELEASKKPVDTALCKLALTEGVNVCNDALEKLQRNRHFYFIVSCILFCILLSICTTNPPYDMHSLYKIILTVISALMCFTGFMSFLWNRMEVNSVMAGKLAMEFAVSKYQNEMDGTA